MKLRMLDCAMSWSVLLLMMLMMMMMWLRCLRSPSTQTRASSLPSRHSTAKQLRNIAFRYDTMRHYTKC